MNILIQLVHLPNLPTLLVISRFDTILPSKKRDQVRRNPFTWPQNQNKSDGFPSNATNAEQSEKPE
jgi:hypothetical protein